MVISNFGCCPGSASDDIDDINDMDIDDIDDIDEIDDIDDIDPRSNFHFRMGGLVPRMRAASWE